MNKQMLKNAMMIINIAVSLSCIFVLILDRIQTYLGIDEYHFLWFVFFTWPTLIFYLYCVAGIILFIRSIIKNRIIVSKKYLLLIPSIIVSIVLNLFQIMSIINPIYLLSGYAIISTILLGIGSTALLFYYLSENNKLYLSAILCFIFPCSIFICYIVLEGIPII
jgi:hypothetical protein